MENILVQLISQLTPISEEEKQDIERSFPIRTYQKDALLIRQGQFAKNAFYVIEGCIREFELIDGEEKTTAFYTKGQSAVNFQSLSNKAPSKVNFVCAEPTTLAILNTDKEQALYKKHPRFETFCRTGMEEMMGAKHEELTETIVLKPEQRYEKLQKERPELLNKVPQYQIASYLGIKPETLSRIRKRALKS